MLCPTSTISSTRHHYWRWAWTAAWSTDPMHALELNLAKVAFKYSFRDKMNDVSRDLVTSYLESIDILLDLRVKGQRNNEQKGMTGATMDDYVLGKSRRRKSKSPALAVNTIILCDPVFGQMAASNTLLVPVATFAAAAYRGKRTCPSSCCPCAFAKQTTPTCTRHGRCNTGDGLPSNPKAAHEGGAEAPAELNALYDLDGFETVYSAEMHAALKLKNGNHAQNLVDVMRLWEAYAEMFSAWREEWTDNSKTSRRCTMLIEHFAFLRAGVHQACYMRILRWCLALIQLYYIVDE
eukprot:2562350-Pleurochrysis_carterae.AAC.3